MAERSGEPGYTRRAFFRLTAAGALALYLVGPRGVQEVIAAPIPGGTLLPGTVPKFTTELVIPPVMPTEGGADTYAIAVKQFSQQILPAPLPQTTVWSYGSTGDLDGTLNYPAFTIEARRGTSATITWINGLVEDGGAFLPHLLPVDPTLHWANPPGGATDRDSRPDWSGKTYVPLDQLSDLDTEYTRYTGPVPIVTHLHGMANVADWSDGYAEAWYLPDADDIPAGFATVGTWYDFFNTKGSGGAWAPGTATFVYPNTERPTTAWYHDHTLGMTRLNVYAGPAGFYIVRSADPADNPTRAGGGAAILPGPAPGFGGPPYYELPLAIQDRSFNAADGSLFYPDTRAFFDAFAGPFIPDSDVSPIWNPEFFGNCMVVNGRTWPYLDVEPRRYRLRILNGCQSRFLILSFDDPKVEAWQIGNDGGYLRKAVRVTQLLMAPAERADVIVDFSKVKVGKSVTLLNRGPDAPFGGGGFRPSDPQTTGLVMRFNVSVALAAGGDPSTPPAQLVMPAVAALTGGTTRSLALIEQMSATPGVPAIPVEALLGTFDTAQGLPAGLVAHRWEDPVTENPSSGTVETWEFYNFTADAHPIHIHERLFQVVNRQRLDKRTGLPIQAPRPPEPTEDGYKDTVIAYPGEVTRVRMRFEREGQYVWHCHIVEHEDNEMMRPYSIGPVQDPES